MVTTHKTKHKCEVKFHLTPARLKTINSLSPTPVKPANATSSSKPSSITNRPTSPISLSLSPSSKFSSPGQHRRSPSFTKHNIHRPTSPASHKKHRSVSPNSSYISSSFGSVGPSTPSASGSASTGIGSSYPTAKRRVKYDIIRNSSTQPLRFVRLNIITRSVSVCTDDSFIRKGGRKVSIDNLGFGGDKYGSSPGSSSAVGYLGYASSPSASNNLSHSPFGHGGRGSSGNGHGFGHAQSHAHSQRGSSRGGSVSPKRVYRSPKLKLHAVKNGSSGSGHGHGYGHGNSHGHGVRSKIVTLKLRPELLRRFK
ncbi:unnamed protein product [Ambrosiozyma monospora]|uniref:Unnamed protein product n=1 Tax=Ambrosiozyma monospora TaxID=43982 RepID=A0ACB5TDU0_AMBMO|nr:unnamed protein product [Ambrosiozyma monospora]